MIRFLIWTFIVFNVISSANNARGSVVISPVQSHDSGQVLAQISNEHLKIEFVSAVRSGKQSVTPLVYLRHEGTWTPVAVDPSAESYQVIAAPATTTIDVPLHDVHPLWRNSGLPSTRVIWEAGTSYEAIVQNATQFDAQQVRLNFHPLGVGQLVAVWQLDPQSEAPRITLIFTPNATAQYSLGYFLFKQAPMTAVDEILVPMYANARRFPDNTATFLNAATPTPISVMETEGIGWAVSGDPHAIPYAFPDPHQSHYGLHIRGPTGQVHPSIFSPIFGRPDALRQANQPLDFTFRIAITKGELYHNYSTVVKDVFGMRDYRKNTTVSLTDAMLNMIDLYMDDVNGGWWKEAKAFYQIESQHSATQASFLTGISLYRLTGDPEIYSRRALPTLEYALSRRGPHFSPTHANARLNTTMNGPVHGYGTNVFGSLWQSMNRRTPILKEIAIPGSGVRAGGNPIFSEWLARYQLTGDLAALAQAKIGADNYINAVINTLPETPLNLNHFFLVQHTPSWECLLKIYEVTGEQHYLDAAIKGARLIMPGMWTQPMPPEDDIVIHPDGFCHGDLLHLTLHKGDPRYRLGFPLAANATPEKTVPAWKVSPVGLGFEQPTTYHRPNNGGRMITMAPWTPWFLRLAQLSQDSDFETYARNAVVGRAGNYPGYYYTTFTDIMQAPDFPLKGPDMSFIYYHHLPVHLSWTIDYLVSEAKALSNGEITFPAQRQFGYAYFDYLVYGHAPGTVMGEDNAWLWLKRGLLESSNIQINYLTAHNRDSFFVVLMNQSDQAETTELSLNAKNITGNAQRNFHQARVLGENGGHHAIRSNKISVIVPPRGLTVLAIDGLDIRIHAHRTFPEPPAPEKPSHVVLDLNDNLKMNAVAIQVEPEWWDAYIWSNAYFNELQSLTVNWQAGDAMGSRTLTTYPYELTIPVRNGIYEMSLVLHGIRADGSTFITEEIEIGVSPPPPTQVEITSFAVNTADGLVQPGETVEILFEILNHGDIAENLTATILPGDWSSGVDTRWDIGNLDMSDSVANAESPLRLRIASNTPYGSNLVFTLRLEANNGRYIANHPLSMTVAAQPSMPPVTVSFDPSAGSIPTPDHVALHPGLRYAPLPSTSRTGYAFIGWYTSAEGGDLITANTIVEQTENHTLFARWSPTPVVNAGTDQFVTDIEEKLWSPSHLQTEAWFDASDAESITLVNGKIAQWNDKSGNNRHATQVDADRRPAYLAQDSMLGNRPSIGSLDTAGKIGLDIPTMTSGRVYVVTYHKNGTDSNFANGQFPTLLSGPGAHGSLRIMGNSGTDLISGGHFNNAGTYKNGSSTSSLAVLPMPASLFRFDASEAQSQSFSLGYNSAHNDRDWAGRYSEWLFTDGTEDLETQQKIEGYLAHKWGISASLPAEHPHKSQTPRLPITSTLEGDANSTGAGSMKFTWSQIGGPAPVTFADSKQANTIVSFPQEWTPQTMSTNAWYDAMDSNTVITLSGKVAEWHDKSGNELHARQAIASRRPAYHSQDPTLGNRPSIGDLSSDGMIGLEIPTLTAKRAYAITHYKNGNAATFDSTEFPTLLSGPGAHGSLRIMGDGGTDLISGGHFNDAGTYKNGSSTSSFAVLPMPASLFRFDASEARSQSFSLGYNRAYNSRDWAGHYSEWLFTGGTEDLATQQKIEGYLAHKWGISAGLPQDHPHRFSSPWNPQEGTYILRLTANDGIGSSYDDIVITVGNGYSVIYDKNGSTGGEAPSDPLLYSENALVTVLAKNRGLVRHGYQLSNWNTAADGSGTAFLPGDTFSMQNANIRLYAQWVEIPVNTLTVNAGDGDGNYAEGEAIRIFADSRRQEGWRFSHWSSSDGGTFSDPNDPFAVFTMPDNSTTLTANYVMNILPTVDAGTDQVLNDNNRPWTPADIATSAWFDASDPQSIHLVNGTVTQWNDLSGNNRHATQTNAGRRPTYDAADSMLGERPSIGDMGTSGMIGLDTPVMPAKRVYVVTYYKSSSTFDLLFSGFPTLLSGPGSNGLYRIMGSSNSADLFAGGHFNNAGTFKNGSTIDSLTVLPMPASILKFEAANAYWQAYSLGYNKVLDGRDWTGHYSEWIFTDGSEDITLQQKIEAYLAHKWGLSAALPSDHPHKSPPLDGMYITTVEGSASDADGDPLMFEWSQVSGPASVTINDPSQASTTIGFPQAGVYKLRLRVYDGFGSSYDELIVTAGDIASPNPFREWAGADGISFHGDYTGDGISAGIAWLLGVESLATKATHFLPSIQYDKGSLFVSFKYLDESKRGYATLRLQHSTTLAADSWTNILIPNQSSTVDGLEFLIIPIPDSDLNQVHATVTVITVGAGKKMFIRLIGEIVLP